MRNQGIDRKMFVFQNVQADQQQNIYQELSIQTLKHIMNNCSSNDYDNVSQLLFVTMCESKMNKFIS